MTSRKVNIHFESEVSQQKLNQKVQFDYIYFLINSDEIPLSTGVVFEPEYISFLNELQFVTNYVSEQEDAVNWWVLDPNSLITKKYNSKVFVHELLLQKEITIPNGVVVHNDEEFELAKENGDLIRLEYSVSGRGTFNKINAPSKLRYPFILAKKRDRVLDFGIFGDSNQSDFYLTLVDNKYCFRGFFISNKSKEMVSPYKELINEALDNFHKLAAIVEQQDQIRGLQADSFLYLENGKLNLEFCHEINFRRSMSQLITSFKTKNLFKNKWSLVLMLPSSKNIFFKEVLEHWKNEISEKLLLPLSPIGKGFCVFLINFNDYDEGVALLESIGRKLGNGNDSVYNEILNLIEGLISFHEYR